MTKHTPGLELDRLIAEKVLGWYQESDMGGPRAWWFSPDDSVNPKELLRFSTDIKAAWLLAERFRFVVVPYGDEQWTALKRDTRANYRATRFAKKYASSSAPHAICLAALGEVESDDH